MSARRRQPPKSAPRTARADENREVARRSLTWTRRGTILAGLGITVAIVIAIVGNHQGTASQQPSGVAVTTVPVDPIGGAPILPVASTTVTPNAYLGSGAQFYIDCFKPVGEKYLLAQISTGQYKNEWIDVFDIKTPENRDVRYLKPPLPKCKAS